jgi:hypothetical protein
MKLKELIILLRNASAQSAEKALVSAGLLQVNYTKSEAYQIYGRSNVDRWVDEGLISVFNKRIDRARLEAVAASSNRATYLPVAER